MYRILLIAILILDIAIPILTYVENVNGKSLDIVYQWPLLEFGFPTHYDRRQAVKDGNLIPSNAIPIDVAPHYNSNGFSRVFVTVPRFTTGVPYSLATVIRRRDASGTPLLQPYPAYSWHQGLNCNGIISAFRVAINECNQMWVIDSGMIGDVQHCPPQLLLFDLATDKLVHRYRFNTSIYTPSASLFITPVLDVKDPPPGHCLRTMVYVSDVTFHGIVIYDYERNVAWRAENKFMYPDPTYGTHTIAGESFTLMDGIFAMSTDKQNLYFHPLASISEYAIPLSILNNQSIWLNNMEGAASDFRFLGHRRSPCAAEAMDSNSNQYCVTFNPIKLISWNVYSSYGDRNLREITADSRLLEFVSGMKVVKNQNGIDELWMLSNRFQKIATGTLDSTEVNFRVLKRMLDDVQSNTDGMDLHHKLIFT